MPNREQLQDELREIEGSYTYEITLDKQRRAREIIKQLNACVCRCCGKTYDRNKSRAEYQGFCSAACQHRKAKELGYRKGKGRTEFDVLKAKDCVGSVTVVV